ncbi:uncharacterized protein [Penaeus vannamei]|uniref:uncharacterized protein n=1 Tax=Penaeus vannamei TaxID=6689 RepID=UPI00387F66A6
MSSVSPYPTTALATVESSTIVKMKAHATAMILALFVVGAFAQSEGSTNSTVTPENLPQVIQCVLTVLPATMREALSDSDSFMGDLQECHSNVADTEIPLTKPVRGGRLLALIREMMKPNSPFPSIMMCMMNKNGRIDQIWECIRSEEA